MIALSSYTVPEGAPLREPPRPPALRNAAYAGQFDWDTLFYDVYRAEPYIVAQGPPFLNFLPLLRSEPVFRNRFGPLFARRRLVSRIKGNEFWLRDAGDVLRLEGALGPATIAVQPNLSDRFAGRRVIHTLSKNNDIRWIVDWTAYYARVHGADGVLLYDNGSTDYAIEEVQAALSEGFPDMASAVVSWPFRYGPQGHLAGAVDGQPTPWDSDFCQTGSLQHARFRFLLSAKSVLNVDIDELVVSPGGGSIFAATEASRHGFVKFAGRWISAVNAHGAARATCRHADFTLRDREEEEVCPPKWCIVPRFADRARHSWSVHNLFGAKHNRIVSNDFEYCHMKGISNGWKYNRWAEESPDPARFFVDDELTAAFAKAGLARSDAQLAI